MVPAFFAGIIPKVTKRGGPLVSVAAPPFLFPIWQEVLPSVVFFEHLRDFDCLHGIDQIILITMNRRADQLGSYVRTEFLVEADFIGLRGSLFSFSIASDLDETQSSLRAQE